MSDIKDQLLGFLIALCLSVVTLVVVFLICVGIDTLNQRSDEMAENDIFALMKANKRMAKNVAVAKKVVAKKDYSGPEGEVVCHFAGQMAAVFDGVETGILRFTVDGGTPGQEDYNGERIGLFFRFQDDEQYGRTVESVQAEFFEAVQLLGVDTISLSEAEIKKAMEALVKNRTPIKIRVTKKKGKGANSSKTYTNFRIVGVAQAERDEPDYSDAGDDVIEDEYADDNIPADDVEPDFSDDAEPETDDAEPAADDYNPSDWIDFEVSYKPKSAPKPLVFKVVAADDETGEVTLERNGKKVKAKYADLILPE